MVNFSRRRAVLAGAASLAAGVAGCAVGEADRERMAPAAHPGTPLVTPWLTLGGGWRAEPQRLPQLARPLGQRQHFVQPVGVAALGDLVLVADAGARTVWRVDRGRDLITPFAPFPGAGAEHGASLQIGNDLSVWLASPFERVVLQYDAAGRQVRRWEDAANAARPVAVAVPHGRAEVLVGDGATAQVVVFDPLGRALRLLGGGRTPALQSISAMALGPDGLYVLDRLAQQVVVLGGHGEVLTTIAEDHLVQPRALAVDRSGRVFVSDDSDQRLKVFRGRRLLASVGGFGRGPGRFGRIEALAVDGNMLYVADSVNAQVQVLLVAPPSMEAGETPR